MNTFSHDDDDEITNGQLYIQSEFNYFNFKLNTLHLSARLITVQTVTTTHDEARNVTKTNGSVGISASDKILNFIIRKFVESNWYTKSLYYTFITYRYRYSAIVIDVNVSAIWVATGRRLNVTSISIQPDESSLRTRYTK